MEYNNFWRKKSSHFFIMYENLWVSSQISEQYMHKTIYKNIVPFVYKAKHQHPTRQQHIIIFFVESSTLLVSFSDSQKETTDCGSSPGGNKSCFIFIHSFLIYTTSDRALGRALGFQPNGRKFKSCYIQNKTKTLLYS